MTVIAWDGKSLAADRRISFGGLHGSTTKVHRLSDGRIAGGSGDSSALRELMIWLDKGADPATFPQSQRAPECSPMLVVEHDWMLRLYERTPYPTILWDKKFAIGSGRDFAMAAMHLGKTAAEAVEVACVFDSGCGNGVDVLTLEDWRE